MTHREATMTERTAPDLPGARSHEGLRNFPPPEDWDHHVRTTRRRTPARCPASSC